MVDTLTPRRYTETMKNSDGPDGFTEADFAAKCGPWVVRLAEEIDAPVDLMLRLTYTVYRDVAVLRDAGQTLTLAQVDDVCIAAAQRMRMEVAGIDLSSLRD